MAYASRTGTRRNLDAMAAAGWRLLVEPSQLGRYADPIPPLPYAVDNGAWGCYQSGVSWDESAFLRLLGLVGHGCDWVVAPDIVAGGLESLRRSAEWLPRLEKYGQLRLVAVQDGMVAADLRDMLGPTVGIFVGGSTPWKLATLPEWGDLARDVGCYLHVARVNSAKRIRYCHHVGADSFDGTSVTRYAVTLPRLDDARRQGTIPWG